MTNRGLTLAASIAVIAVVGFATPAAAAPSPGDPVVRATGLISPFGLAVDNGGRAIVSQNVIGSLIEVSRKGDVDELTTAPGQEIAAPATDGRTVYFVRTAPDRSTSVLVALLDGVEHVVADLAAAEETLNPDSVNTYGFVGLPDDCAAQFEFDPVWGVLSLPSYAGLTDLQPSGAAVADGTVYVADAEANAVWAVRDGEVSVAGVLPPAPPITVTAEWASGFPWPDCVVGHDYLFEPVPTDVQVGADGWLYVTSETGGPSGGVFGARGSVVKVDPATGEIATVARGLTYATGLALAANGDIYVAELFGGEEATGQVSVVPAGTSTPQPAFAVDAPWAIDIRGETLYVTTSVFEEAVLTVVPLSGTGHSRSDR